MPCRYASLKWLTLALVLAIRRHRNPYSHLLLLLSINCYGYISEYALFFDTTLNVVILILPQTCDMLMESCAVFEKVLP